MDTYLLLVVGHLLGTILGVGGATMIEVHLKQALKDGVMSADESALLKLDYRVVRIGLILCILTGFGFLLLFTMTGDTFRLYEAGLWVKLCIIAIIAINTLLLQAKRIGLYWGSALSFVSWWSATIIGIFNTERFAFDLFGYGTFLSKFSSLSLIYIVAVVCGAGLLHYFRTRATTDQTLL